MPSLFDSLPFRQAIDALRERLAMPKPEFLRLDAANRSRAFTMARVNDLQILENIHDELSIAIENGETWPQFAGRIAELKERSVWTGTSPWHHRLVYDQNLGMAYSAGRVQQGTASGLRVWQYLPSISATPRGEHEPYYYQLYRMAPGSPVPPIDFNCNCGWVWKLEDELEGIDVESLPVFDPPVPKSGFVWSATDYFSLTNACRIHDEQRAATDTRRRLVLVNSDGGWSADPELNAWVELAVDAASKITQRQFERVLSWAEKIVRGAPNAAALLNLQQRLDDALAVIADDDQAELDHLATMAAMLRGRVDTDQRVRRAA